MAKGKGKEKTEPLEDQADKDAQAKQKAKGGSKYGRKKGDKQSGIALGKYRKQTVDETLPKILQDLITKQRTAREILEEGDASRFGELPQLYADIRGLEKKRSDVLFQLKSPVDDNKDTDYVVSQYELFLQGKPAHFSAKGKKDKYSFSSDGKEFTEKEIQFALTKSTFIDGLNKNSLRGNANARTKFQNKLTLPTDTSDLVEEAKEKTKEQEEADKSTSPGERAEKRKADRNKMMSEGYRAFKLSKFNDKNQVTVYSTEYVAFLKKYNIGRDEQGRYQKTYQKQYLKDNPVKTPDPPEKESPSAGGEGGSSSDTPKKEQKGGGGRRNPATSSSKRAVGMPNDGSTRKDLVGELTGEVNPFMMFGNTPQEVVEGLQKARAERDFTTKDAKSGQSADDVYIGWAMTHFGDPDWLAKHPPGSEEYEGTKAGLDYYTSIGVEPPYNYPSASSSDKIPSGGGGGGSSSGGGGRDEHPTADGVKTESGETPGTESPSTEEERQETVDRSFDEIKTTPGKRPGTVEEYEILDASRGAPPDSVVPGVPLAPSQIAKNMSDNIAEENKQRGKASIERLKEEIKAYHLVYDNNIKEFRENPHKKDKDDALKSNDIEVVRAHHKKMEEKIREYYRSGDADSLNVGVIVPIDTFLQQYLSRSTPQVSNIQTPATGGGTATTQGAQHRHGHLTKKGNDPFGHSIAQGTYYQRGGLSSYRQQPVANHTLRIKSTSAIGTLADPKVYVDAPMNNFLQRPLKLTSSLKIKS